MGRIAQSVRQTRRLSTRRVRQQAERLLRLLIVGSDEVDRAALVRVFVPESASGAERHVALDAIRSETLAGSWRDLAAVADCVVVTPRAATRVADTARQAVAIDPYRPELGIDELLRRFPDHRLALGRHFPWLRDTIAAHLLKSMAVRNASLAALSAIPEIVPSPLSFLWALGGFASDSVVLTANQIRLAFELAALYGLRPGWSAQRAQVLSIVAGAFGWRALARAAVGVVPGGAGLAAKTAIAYSASLGVGRALWTWQKRQAANGAEATGTRGNQLSG